MAILAHNASRYRVGDRVIYIDTNPGPKMGVSVGTLSHPGGRSDQHDDYIWLIQLDSGRRVSCYERSVHLNNGCAFGPLADNMPVLQQAAGLSPRAPGCSVADRQKAMLASIRQPRPLALDEED